MNPWIETALVSGLAVLGVLLGRGCSRLPKPYWLLGYVVPLLVVVLVGCARRYSALEFVPPFSWLVAGRTEFVLPALLATLLLTTPLSRLPRPRDRRLVFLFMILLVGSTSVWPFLAAALNRGHLASIQTRFDADGVCRQSTDYNCGPAAAVTALRQLGIPAEEGPIAIAAHTSAAIGTPPDLLCAALQTLYATNGLVCHYRSFNSVAELRQAGLTLAVIKFGLLVDHYVAVLSVEDDRVVVADPFQGKVSHSVEVFRQKWRGVGIVLKREG